VPVAVLGFLNGLTGWLDDVSSNWWFYLVIFIIALLDSVVPVVPSETTVIIGGIAAGQGDLVLWLVIVMVTFSFFWNASLPQFEATTMNFLGRETYRYNTIRMWGSIGFIVTAIGLGWLINGGTWRSCRSSFC